LNIEKVLLGFSLRQGRAVGQTASLSSLSELAEEIFFKVGIFVGPGGPEKAGLSLRLTNCRNLDTE
jgi:hypothetical protein